MEFNELEYRIEKLKEMNDYLRKNIDDESILYSIWHTVGIPDGAYESDFKNVAMNDSNYAFHLEAFARTILEDSKK